MRITIFQLLFFITVTSAGQTGRQLKTILREIDKGNVSVEVVSLGDNIPVESKKIISELDFFQNTEYLPQFKSLNLDCQNNQEVNDYFSNALRTKFFTFQRSNSDVSNLETLGTTIINVEKLTDDQLDYFNKQIVDYILIQSKKKKKTNIQIIIPFFKVDNLNSYLKDGWSSVKPKKKLNLDSAETKNCSNSKIWVYRSKPCKDLTEAKIDLSSLSLSAKDAANPGTTLIYPPENKMGTGSSSEYIIRGVNVCCDRIMLNFKKEDGNLLKSVEFIPDDYMVDNGYWNYLYPINADDYGGGFQFWGDYWVPYLISMKCYSNNDWSEEVDLGKYSFSKCSK
jgi:hypothetical protein